ncbi:hypothetical protein FA95DRAFT_1562297 [Auriscalpium vulgare]|uniref:Uncharacterized protein n=1 Tax=Auriscalpium vulgare TaxID=40419 RepID=A0ACB8RKQ1_9AGAM|nr:hypothetical protein FA95DRAFT_1562297 [Auriscalpium vulgare]
MNTNQMRRFGLSVTSSETHAKRRLSASQRGADIILRSSHGEDFYVHKAVLSTTSSLFWDMFSLPVPQTSTHSDTADKPTGNFDTSLPIVCMSEESQTLDDLITAVYEPICLRSIESFDRFAALLEALQKYEVTSTSALVRHLRPPETLMVTGPDVKAFRFLAVAIKHRLADEAKLAARLMLDDQMTFEQFGSLLCLLPTGYTLIELSRYREQCRDVVHAALIEFISLYANSVCSS